VDYLFGSYTNSLSENWCIFRKSKKEKKGTHPWVPFSGGEGKFFLPRTEGKIFTTRVVGTRDESKEMIMFQRCLRTILLSPRMTFLGVGKPI